MRYLTAIFTVFTILIVPAFASQPAGETPRERFKSFVITQMLPQELRYPSTDEMKPLVLAKPRTEWSTYKSQKYYEDHQAALDWFKALQQTNQLGTVANTYQRTIGVGKQVRAFEQAAWPGAIANYEKVISICVRDQKEMAEECEWSKAPYEGVRGFMKKHNVLLTYLATAFISVRQDVKQRYIDEKLAAYDLRMQQQAQPTGSGTVNLPATTGGTAQ